MPRHKRESPRVFRIWMTLNAVMVLGFAGWILWPNASDPDVVQSAPALSAISAQNQAQAEQPVPTRDALLSLTGVRFGLSTPQAPWSSAEIDKVAAAVGAHPTMVQYFVKWTEDFRSDAIPQTYKQGALPVISWEPWAGIKLGPSQPAYALAKITSGAFDAYITKFATGVRDQKWPVAIRFAHEMNGNWYPWAEKESGNHPGDFVNAWRHVHDIFTQVGANNVIWIWSPNVVQGLPKVDLAKLYPGDAYIDWLGMVGYSMTERTAAEVFQPTMTQLRTFSQKPIVITETGVAPGSHQTAWIADFFHWLPQHPDVIGFIWFEFSKEQGGRTDWRMSAKPATAKAFHDAIAKVTLALPPPR